jgi:hypothetical protein
MLLRGLIVCHYLYKKAAGLQLGMVQVLPVVQDADAAAPPRPPERAMPNTEKAFSTAVLPHSGQAIELTDDVLSTSFSNLVPQF